MKAGSAGRKASYSSALGIPESRSGMLRESEACRREVETEYENGIPQLSVAELKRRLDAGHDLLILDVREPWEYEAANIGGTLIPQDDVFERLGEIDPGREIAVFCRTGNRSQVIAELLCQCGYPSVANVAGGIVAWSDEIDPAMQKY